MAFVGVGTIASIPSASSASSVPLPAGVQQNDLLLCVMTASAGSSVTTSAPSGWEPAASVAAGSFNTGLYAYWKVAGASEAGPYDFRQSAVSGNGAARIYVWRGNHATTPINAAAASGFQPSTSSPAAPNITTTASGCTFVMAALEYNSGSPAITMAGALTDRGGSTASARYFQVGDEVLGAAGAVTGRAMSSSPAGAFVALAIAIAPAAVPATLSGDAALDAAVAAGALASSPSDLSGGVTLDAASPAGTLGAQPGVIATAPWRAPVTGALLANATIPKLAVLRVSDMSLVLALVDVVTSGAGVIQITNAALLSGVRYLLVACNADGSAFGCEAYVAA